MRFLIYAIGAALFLAMMSIVGNMNAEDKRQERERYCEMVDIYNETGGEYGWPPYRDNIECED